MTHRPEKFVLQVAHDAARGVYHCIDPRKPLHLTQAKSLMSNNLTLRSSPTSTR